MEEQSSADRQQLWAHWGAVAMFVVNAILLVAYHVINYDDTDTVASSAAAAAALPIQSTLDKILFGCLVLMAFELLDFLTKNSGKWLHSKEIPVRGKHLDDLRSMDKLCIGFSKANTAPFTYLYLRYCWTQAAASASAGSNMPWDWNEMSVQNTLLPLPFLFVMFDASYSLLHYILHWQSVYPYIHKHHHIQKAPSRANVDAVNVHPIEFVLGEYNHLLVVWLWQETAGMMSRMNNSSLPLCLPGMRLPVIHVAAALLFLVVGGILAGINHTRYDVVVSIPVPTISAASAALSFLRLKSSTASTTTTTTAVSNTKNSSSSRINRYWTAVPIYDSKAHDVHHRIPQSNYGQYTMFWDVLFGSYRPYNPSDRVNPDSQLDPKTGKTVTSAKQHEKSQ